MNRAEWVVLRALVERPGEPILITELTTAIAATEPRKGRRPPDTTLCVSKVRCALKGSGIEIRYDGGPGRQGTAYWLFDTQGEAHGEAL